MLAVAAYKIFERDNLGTNKSFLKVRMNFAGGLRCRSTNLCCPGPDLLGPGGEVGLQSKQRVAAADYAIQAGFVEAKV